MYGVSGHGFAQSVQPFGWSAPRCGYRLAGLRTSNGRRPAASNGNPNMLQQSASFPAWLQHDMEQVNALIRRQFDSEVVLIRQVVEFILHGEERVRPALHR